MSCSVEYVGILDGLTAPPVFTSKVTSVSRHLVKDLKNGDEKQKRFKLN